MWSHQQQKGQNYLFAKLAAESVTKKVALSTSSSRLLCTVTTVEEMVVRIRTCTVRTRGPLESS